MKITNTQGKYNSLPRERNICSPRHLHDFAFQVAQEFDAKEILNFYFFYENIE